MKISPADFDYIADLAKSVSALELEVGKEYLVESRLAPLATESGCASLEALCRKVRGESNRGPLASRVIDALTTNETLFFRDFHPFEALRLHTLPELLRSRAESRRLSIWSAASSTGQEAYSVAMMLLESFPELAAWDLRILGTDISPTVLERAREARYSKLEVNRGLPAPYLLKYFEAAGKDWKVKEKVRKLVEFRELNLVDHWGSLPTFDIVLIRNVLIYMGPDARRRILMSIREHLSPDGCLLLGSAETLLGDADRFQPQIVNNSVIYRLAPAA